ncbi:hypothetical protein CYLTODRAFT_422072 [Cylindrobasidium torrendii FP15055 ss-10]|uniref:Uncharacterized protein n=1 Tax=Cylindrobasidium torrendii FP15055 ss-10 TaxID=1314674 RepID=A0A0D7BBP4_9AGAR|nr:hypothetical protein CYLTODRAFT_422072 [Cylindrobasidium torrendii FP15055 ss-10]
MFKTQYPQPFSLLEAISLDVAVITEEIARLQDSLRRLRETQDILTEHLREENDVDISKAVEENIVTIASQEERVEMLKVALKEKGVVYNPHYDLPTSKPPATAAPARPVGNGLDDDDPLEENDNGLHL